jgi:hypothetical protein
MLEAAERDGDRIAFTALTRELRQTLGGLFELMSRAAEANPAEAPKMTLKVIHIGRGRSAS